MKHTDLTDLVSREDLVEVSCTTIYTAAGISSDALARTALHWMDEHDAIAKRSGVQLVFAAEERAEKAEAERDALRVELANLFAMVQGEVPSLLEDHHSFVTITAALQLNSGEKP